MAKKTQFKSICVFCGEKSPSDEHVFPQWLGRRLNYPCKQSAMHRRVMQIIDGKTVFTPILKKTNHHISAVTTRKVCKTCNNGWLSQIESNTTPIYEKMIKYNITLNQHEQKTLASWAYLIALKWDLMETQISGYASSHYHEFFKNKTPSNNTRVWIGFTDNDDIECFHRTAATLENITDPIIRSIRSTTLKIGTAVFFVLTHDPETLELLESANTKSSHKLQQIYPHIKTINDVTDPFAILNHLEMAVLTKVCGMQHDPDLLKQFLGDEAAAATKSIYTLVFSERDSLALRISRHISGVGLTGR